MTSYQDLSYLYDAFMQDAPYDDWMAWMMRELPLNELNAADVGCGTGRLTRMLARHCRSVVGVDISEHMLSRAMEQALSEDMALPWLCQDMRMLRLPQPVQLVVSSCDCVNYLTTNADIAQCFSAVHANLKEDGWFCFDVLGPKRVQTLREGLWYDLKADAAVLFETQADLESGEISYEVHAFVQLPGGLYRRVQEHHRQQFHDLNNLEVLLEQCGFEVNQILGDFGRAPLAQSDRWAFICRKSSH